MRARTMTAVTFAVGLAMPSLVPDAAAGMTLEQARSACRAEIPNLPGTDRGNSRGFKDPNGGRMRECVRAKMGRSHGSAS
jgi:hypothetical protein